MIYDNSKVRRQDRLLDESCALSLLAEGEYGVLSMCDPESSPYGVPVNYVWDGHSYIYIHCAPEGRKLSCISKCNKVSFCIVGKTNIVPHKFTTAYESLVIRCIARTGLEADERMRALNLLLEKYSPNDMVVGMKYAEKSFRRTEIIRLEILEISGKQKNVAF